MEERQPGDRGLVPRITESLHPFFRLLWVTQVNIDRAPVAGVHFEHGFPP
jgi:hypothetical protein